LYRDLTGEARQLVRQHQRVLDRLPRTFLANTLVEIEKWPSLFEPEKAYFRAVLAQLSAMDAAQLKDTFGSLEIFEQRTGCDRVGGHDADTLQRQLLDRLQRSGQYSAWRQEVNAIFQKLEPRV
jgi:hypothetical protein